MTRECHDVVVAAVDDSAGSRAALQWAAEEAVRRGSELRVVHAVCDQTSPGREMARDRDRAQASLDELVESVRSTTDGAINVRRVLSVEDPVAALVHASTSSDLLVVGARRVGGGPGDHVGSTTRRCLQEAACPVVVVPNPPR